MAEELKTLTPSFLIKANGQRLAVEKEADVKEIVIIEKIDAPSQFMIYVSDMAKEWPDSDDFFIGSKIKIQMGYKDNIEEIMSGEVTKIEFDFEKNSDLTFTIKGQNDLHRLRRAIKNRSFSDKSDKEIIEEMAGDASLSKDIGEIGKKNKFTTQTNQTDYDFIMDLANMYGCKVWAKEGKLYVKKLESSSDDIVLEWGKTLHAFHPVLDSEKIFTEVEVIGWNHDKNESVKGTAKPGDITAKIGGDNIGANAVKENIAEAKTTVRDTSVPDTDTADKVALGILTSNSMKYMTATGKCEGNNKIHAGMVIKINEVGSRFSGKYYVNSVKHVLTANEGYSTYFELSRNATE